MYLQLFVAFTDAYPDIGTAVRHFFRGAAATLAGTDYADDRARDRRRITSPGWVLT